MYRLIAKKIILLFPSEHSDEYSQLKGEIRTEAVWMHILCRAMLLSDLSYDMSRNVVMSCKTSVFNVQIM